MLSAQRTPGPLDALTEREREVLALVAEGLPNKQIARRLEISEKTVKAHLTSVFRAIGVTTACRPACGRAETACDGGGTATEPSQRPCSCRPRR